MMKLRLLVTKLIFILLPGIGFLLSCNKTNFLDKKPSSDLLVPTTPQDFQALLDNTLVMSETPELGELSADNFYLTYAFWESLNGQNTKEYNAYIWAQDIYEGQGNVGDWDLPYEQVFYANVVLQGLVGLATDSSNKALVGAAYFIRAYAFYNIAQVFAPVYDSATAASDMYGIPLRLNPDVNTVSTRSNVDQTYKQILSDLQAASSLLPPGIPVADLNRPSKPAALAMLARVYLSMGNYGQAGLYADSCLQFYDSLVDYNTVDTSGILPFTQSNAEVLYQSHLLSSSNVLLGAFYPGCVVDSALYQSYTGSDLRRSVFYRINSAGQPNIKGSYNASLLPFSGLATDEVYLIRAECSARAANTVAALSDLNTLLEKRWVTGAYIPYPPGTMAVLDTVLKERRKELAFRGLRWTDLRRLNKEGAGIGLTRVLNGQIYSLSPVDPRYVLPIPPDVLSLSGIAQNPR